MIVGILGELGKGKTATASYMALNYYMKGHKIYSNYKIQIPVAPAFGMGMCTNPAEMTFKSVAEMVTSYNDVERIHNGYAVFDELWSWLDSRMSSSHQNKFISGILLKSRKRGFNLIYTCQGLHQIEKRIRGITDYLIIPDKRIVVNGRNLKYDQDILNPFPEKYFLDYSYIDAYVFSNVTETPLQKFSFKLSPVAKCYDTTEEIKDMLDSELDKGIEREKGLKIELEKTYPGSKITLVERSGQYKDSFDIELDHDRGLFIFDVVKLTIRKGINYYIDLGIKSEKKFIAVQKKRNCKNYFAFEYQDIWFFVDSLKIWEMTNKRTISLKRILPESKKIDFLITDPA